jgi:hypothetical protein
MGMQRTIWQLGAQRLVEEYKPPKGGNFCLDGCSIKGGYEIGTFGQKYDWRRSFPFVSSLFPGFGNSTTLVFALPFFVGCVDANSRLVARLLGLSRISGCSSQVVDG